jgi:hypothetical protein
MTAGAASTWRELQLAGELQFAIQKAEAEAWLQAQARATLQ